MSASVALDPVSVQRFNRLLAETARHSRKNLPGIIFKSATLFVRSARASTPIARKNRRIVDNPAYTGRGSNEPKRAIEAYTNVGKNPKYWPTRKGKNDRRHPVPRRGTAKNAWAGAYRALGKSSRTYGAGKGAKYGDADKRLRASIPYIEVASKAGYVIRMRPRLMSDALDKVSKQMESNLTKHARRAARKWR